jgi:hypothetical protein
LALLNRRQEQTEFDSLNARPSQFYISHAPLGKAGSHAIREEKEQRQPEEKYRNLVRSMIECEPATPNTTRNAAANHNPVL